MNMSSLGVFVSSHRARSALLELLSLPMVLMRRRMPPIEEMSDHLRRDVGLPPLDGDGTQKGPGKPWLRVWPAPRW